MTDDRPKRIDLTDTTKEYGRTLVHLLGYHGDGGENESVLSVTTDLSPGENFPVSGRVFVGTPQKSPLLEGYFPDLGAFSCSPDAADRLADELKAAAAAARAAMDRVGPGAAPVDKPSIAELQDVDLCAVVGFDHCGNFMIASDDGDTVVTFDGGMLSVTRRVPVPSSGDDRLSISELTRIASEQPARDARSNAQIKLRNAAPVLLEIAAAALAWRDQRAANLEAALAKVRP